jgi:tetratricopeptide (TPR) repeat protein
MCQHASVNALLVNLGMAEIMMGHLRQAREYFLEVERTRENRPGEKKRLDVVLQTNLGRLAGKMGDEVEAKRRHERAIGIARQLGRPLQLAEALVEYADYLVQLGDFIQAEGLYREARNALPESYLLLRARILFGQAQVQAHLGAYEQARILGEESLALARTMHESSLEEEIERWGIAAQLKEYTGSSAGDSPAG